MTLWRHYLAKTMDQPFANCLKTWLESRDNGMRAIVMLPERLRWTCFDGGADLSLRAINNTIFSSISAYRFLKKRDCTHMALNDLKLRFKIAKFYRKSLFFFANIKFLQFGVQAYIAPESDIMDLRFHLWRRLLNQSINPSAVHCWWTPWYGGWPGRLSRSADALLPRLSLEQPKSLSSRLTLTDKYSNFVNLPLSLFPSCVQLTRKILVSEALLELLQYFSRYLGRLGDLRYTCTGDDVTCFGSGSAYQAVIFYVLTKNSKNVVVLRQDFTT